jgi:hypothetical protein
MMAHPEPGSKKGVGCAVALGVLVVIVILGAIGGGNSGSSGTQTAGTDMTTRKPAAPTMDSTVVPDVNPVAVAIVA